MHTNQNSASWIIIFLLLLSVAPLRAQSIETTVSIERYTVVGNSLRHESGHFRSDGRFEAYTSGFVSTFGVPLVNFVPFSGKPIMMLATYNAYKTAGLLPSFVRSANSYNIGFITYVMVSKGGPAPKPNPMPKPPTITKPLPAPFSVVAGTSVTLTVAATGTGPLRYQWQKGLVDIPGATGTRYVVTTDPSESGANSYFVTVKNIAGETFSWTIVSSIAFHDFENTPRIYLKTPERQIIVGFLNDSNSTTAAVIKGGQKFTAGWNPVAIGDMDGDTNDDVIFQHDDGRLSLWRMNGLAFLQGVTLRNPGSNWRVVGLGSFNEDGSKDILLRNRANGRLSVWYMSGTTFQSSAVISNTPAGSWKPVAVADFNGDGKSDILLQNSASVVALWTMNGIARTASTTLRNGKGAPGWHVAGTGDFNYDGKTDIMWAGTDRRMATWYMDGTNFLRNSYLNANRPYQEGRRIIGQQ